MHTVPRAFILFVFALYHVAFADDQNEEKRKNSLYAHGFGPYYVHIQAVEVCRSEEKYDRESVNFSMQAYRVNRNTQELRGTFTHAKDVQFRKMLLLVEAQKSGGIFTLEYKKVTDEPCESIIFGPLLKKLLHPDSSCTVKKGIYKLDKMNIDSMIHVAFPDMQYNTYRFQVEWYSKFGALGCVKILVDVKPLKKKLKISRSKPKMK